MTQDHEPRQGWEHLVTDGHVRAARLRRIQPAMVVTAIILMAVGLFFLSVIKPPTMTNERATVLNAEVAREQRRVLEVFSGMPAPRIRRGALKNLMLSDVLAVSSDQILIELNRSGEFPKQIAIQDVTPSAFWRAPWPQKGFVATGTRKVKLVGALVNAGGVEYPFPARFLAVYRKKGDDWQMVTVQGPDFLSVPGKPSVLIETIPVTMKPLLKTKE